MDFRGYVRLPLQLGIFLVQRTLEDWTTVGQGLPDGHLELKIGRIQTFILFTGGEEDDEAL